MSHTAHRRGAQALGAAAILLLTVTGSSTARADESGQHTQAQYECHYLNRCADAGPVIVDDNAPEYLQLGAGVVAGIGLAGAGMAAASRRGRGPAASRRNHGRQAHPA
jgi:hypothetical protein